MSKIWLLPIVIAAIIITLFATAGDGWYRYPCQDPENFDAPECKAPICNADQSCTDYLIRKEG